MNSQIIETGLPAGVKWNPKIVPHAPVKPKAKGSRLRLTEINRRLAATRGARLAAAKENSVRITGKQSF